MKARIADYEKRGVIRGYQAILNEDQLELEKVTAVGHSMGAVVAAMIATSPPALILPSSTNQPPMA